MNTTVIPLTQATPADAPCIWLLGAADGGEVPRALLTLCDGMAPPSDDPPWGWVDLGARARLHLCAVPETLAAACRTPPVAVLLLLDVGAPDALATARRLLALLEQTPPAQVVIATRPVAERVLQAFARALVPAGVGVVPVLQADPGDRAQLAAALDVVAALLAFQAA